MQVRDLTQKDPARWQHFAHGADIGIRGIGATEEEAFEQAALALTAVLAEPGTIASERMIEVECQAPDRETLLVDWLNALIYEMAVHSILFRRFEVHIEEDRLHGKAWGEEIDIVRHQPAVEVKGATYTTLSVGRNAQGEWVAQCVVDV